MAPSATASPRRRHGIPGDLSYHPPPTPPRGRTWAPVCRPPALPAGSVAVPPCLQVPPVVPPASSGRVGPCALSRLRPFSRLSARFLGPFAPPRPAGGRALVGSGWGGRLLLSLRPRARPSVLCRLGGCPGRLGWLGRALGAPARRPPAVPGLWPAFVRLSLSPRTFGWGKRGTGPRNCRMRGHAV
jgi:hypothetical protein